MRIRSLMIVYSRLLRERLYRSIFNLLMSGKVVCVALMPAFSFRLSIKSVASSLNFFLCERIRAFSRRGLHFERAPVDCVMVASLLADCRIDRLNNPNVTSY